MEKRVLGNTGEMLTILGFGGVIVTDETQKDSNDYVSEALDHGINYFDVAPGYGNAQERLGPALEGKRQSIFLACKTEKRTAKEAEEALYDSLRKLKTDWFDLYQLHGVSTMEEVHTILGPGGALEAFVKAKEKGLIRHIGFSAHTEEAALALLESFPMISALFPVNWSSIFNNGFGKKIMEKAIEKGTARLALKAMARTSRSEGAERKYPKPWYEPIDDRELAGLALRYTLSQPVTSAIPPGDIQLFRWALDTAENFTPISSEEESILREKSKGLKPLFPVT